MPCLLVLLALLLPRLVIVLLWLFSDWLSWAFNSWLLPLLGFFFLPYTTLAYTAAMLHNNRSVDGLWLVLVIVAVLADIGVIGGGASRRRRRK